MDGRTILLALAILLVATSARADDDAGLARQRYTEGRRLYAAGRFTEALSAFEAARAALPRPELDYNIALCLERLQRDGDAADAYARFLAARPDDAEAGILRDKIARLRALAAPPPPAATTLAVAPPSAATPARGFVGTPRGIATVTLLGSTAALLVAAAATGGVALSDRDAYDAGCARRACDPSLYDGAHRLAIATDVLIGVGVAAAATGLVLFLTRPRPSPRAFAAVSP
jgi:tetratricopeptide (TPR) repeat protein